MVVSLVFFAETFEIFHCDIQDSYFLEIILTEKKIKTWKVMKISFLLKNCITSILGSICEYVNMSNIQWEFQTVEKADDIKAILNNLFSNLLHHLLSKTGLLLCYMFLSHTLSLKSSSYSRVFWLYLYYNFNLHQQVCN